MADITNPQRRIFREDLLESSPDPQPPKKDDYEKIKKRTAEMILELASHTLVMVLSLGSIWIIHLVLEASVGKEKTFFDVIPIRWIIDVGDIVIIGKFLFEAVKDFSKSR